MKTIAAVLLAVSLLHSSPSLSTDFEAEHGKIDAFVLPALIADASRYLGLSYAEVERTFTGDYSEAQVEDGQTVPISEGWNLLSVKQDTGSANVNVFDKIEFRNTGSERAVLVLEGIAADGSSLGFSYIRLEPGSTYLYGHNPWCWKCLVTSRTSGAGIHDPVVAVISARWVKRLRGDLTTCQVVRPKLAKNFCTGGCPTAGTCTATTFIGYGPFGTLGRQPNTCACQ